jgi:NADH-quinone oxidoreductase subunit H
MTGTALTVVDTEIRAVAVLGVFLVLPLVVGQTEHKVMAHMQGRLGPMYAGGFHGWAQLVADGVKFAQKEEIVPAAADRGVFRLAPAVALLPYLVAMTAIPLSPTLVGADLDSGLLFVLAVSAVGVLGTLMAGWASANKYALLGAMRSAAQLLAYELPVVLAASSIALAAGTLSLTGIAQAWTPLWLVSQAPAAFVLFVAGLAELQRPPFDIPIADSELVVGPYTEYGGLRFAFFLLAEYAGIVVLAGLVTVLYLGGWRGPGPALLAPLWSLAKIGAVSVVVVWFRVSWPRLREDQLQRLAWGVLVPVALVQLAITATLVVIG